MAKGGGIKVNNKELLEYANTQSQEEVLEDIIPILNKKGIKLRYGTSIGKSPQTILFDLKNKDGILRINKDGYYGNLPEFNHESFMDANDFENLLDYYLDDIMADGGIMARGKKLDEFETYHKTLSSALDEAERFVNNRGYEFSEDRYFPDLTIGGVPYGQTISTRRDLIEVGGKQRTNVLLVQIYRMDSGTYELNMYFGKSNYADGGMMAKGGKLKSLIGITSKDYSGKKARIIDSAYVKDYQKLIKYDSSEWVNKDGIDYLDLKPTDILVAVQYYDGKT
jgi:hypothetical protein